MTRRQFSFKLEPVRTVRKHTESLAMKDLAVELAQAANIGRELGSAQHRLTRAQEPELGRIGAIELTQRQLYLERIERELEDARLRADTQARFVEAARGRLEVAAREREALDRLEDRRRTEHTNELRRADRTASDEISARMRPSALGGLA